MADAKETVWVTADNSKLIKGLKQSEDLTKKSAKKMESLGKVGFGGARKNIDAMAVGLAKVFAVVKALEGAAKIVEGAISGWKMRQAENNFEFGKALEQYDKMQASFAAFPGLGPVIASIWKIWEAATGVREEMERLKNQMNLAKQVKEMTHEAERFFKRLDMTTLEKSVDDVNKKWEEQQKIMDDLGNNIAKTKKTAEDYINAFKGIDPVAAGADMKKFRQQQKLLEKSKKDRILLDKNYNKIQKKALKEIQTVRKQYLVDFLKAREDAEKIALAKSVAAAKKEKDKKNKIKKEQADEDVKIQKWIDDQILGDLKDRLKEKDAKIKKSQEAKKQLEDRFQLRKVSLSTVGFQTKEMVEADRAKDNQQEQSSKERNQLLKEIKKANKDIAGRLNKPTSNIAVFDGP